MYVSASVCVCVMGVFPSVEHFQGPLDNMEFIRGMPHKGSFLSPDSIASCFQHPRWFGQSSELVEEPENQEVGGSGTKTSPETKNLCSNAANVLPRNVKEQRS